MTAAATNNTTRVVPSPNSWQTKLQLPAPAREERRITQRRQQGSSSSSSQQQHQPKKPRAPTCYLQATILSAYDLPSNDSPSHVELSLLPPQPPAFPAPATAPPSSSQQQNGATYGSSSSSRISSHASDAAAGGVTNNNTTSNTVRTGPPSQRHKDKNSFKFTDWDRDKKAFRRSSATAAGGSGNGEVVAAAGGATTKTTSSEYACARNTVRLSVPLHAASLAQMYRSMVRVQVVYKDPDQTNLFADYRIRQLTVSNNGSSGSSETKWIILQLKEKTSAETEHLDDNSSGGEQQQEDDDDDLSFDESIIPPTLRLTMTLVSPYRPGIAALVSLCCAWFRVVDAAEQSVTALWRNFLLRTNNLHNSSRKNSTMPKWFRKEQLLVPVVLPVVTALVVCSPVLIGISVALFPLLLPLAAILVLALVIGTTVLAALYASTKSGRAKVYHSLQPALQLARTSPAGQTFLYPTTNYLVSPVEICRNLLPGPDRFVMRCLVSLLIDATGSISYLLPGVGELIDLVWAPLQTILIMAMYEDNNNDGNHNVLGDSLKYVSFVEEILPFTDVVPTATMGWLMQYGAPLVLGSGGVPFQPRPNRSSSLQEALKNGQPQQQY